MRCLPFHFAKQLYFALDVTVSQQGMMHQFTRCGVMQTKVPHNRLSFGEELDEEFAEPDAAFSLAQSTASR